MANESIILDPSEVAQAGRSELNINSGAIQVRAEGIDWGTSEIQAFMAEARQGESMVDFRIPNRQIVIPIVMRTVGAVSFNDARGSLAEKVGQFQATGGAIKRVLSDGTTTLFADIVNASLTLPGGWIQAHKDVENEAVLTLEALPDFYGAEETLSDHTETSAAEIRFTETTSAGGDFPLGDRVRVVVDEDDADNQRGLFWSFRSRHYSSASTAASAYEAEALTTLDTATRVAKAGASGGTVVTHGTVSTDWTPVVGTNLTAGNYLTHTGTNRIYARVFSTAGTVSARFVYDVGDLVYPTENPEVSLYNVGAAGTFHILDLGEVRLDPTPTGTHRWQGQIQARSTTAGTFSVDRIWIANQDESAGLLRSPQSTAQGLATFSARSNFTTESGAITGDSPQVGAVWTVVTGSDTDDFTEASDIVTRSGNSDTAARAVTIGTGSVAAIAARVVFAFDIVSSTPALQGLYLRGDGTYTNYLRVNAKPGSTGLIIEAVKTPGLSPVILGQANIGDAVYNTDYELLAYVFADGSYTVLAGLSGFPVKVLEGQDSTLITGGTLASGRYGLYDYSAGIPTVVRSYKQFSAWVPPTDAVMFASQSVELNTKGIIREDSTGTAYGPVSYVTGDLPRMPNRSSAGTVEFMAKASRGDFQTSPDPGIDDISARVYRRPSYLFIS